MKLCKDCKHSAHGWVWSPLRCYRNEHTEQDLVTGEIESKGVVDCELARDPAYCENPSDPRYCGPEGLLWEAAD